MNSKRHVPGTSFLIGLALALALAVAAPSAHANVYASNIKINGILQGSATVGQGSSVTISYILNEAASQGVSIKILSGGTPVRTITLAGGGAGTTVGLNSVIWDGKDDSSTDVGLGNYTVTVTAGSDGYLDWTQIITNSNSKVYWPSGIVADTSTNSPYYGRIMVANGVTTALNVAPHPVGIVKFNADGSEADEGQSTPPSTFRTDAYLSDSCRQIKYGTDDRVYFFDWVSYGRVWACDMQMTTSELLLDGDLNPNFNTLTYGPSGMDVTDPGTTNGLVWVTDAADYPSVGTWAFPLTNNGVADSVNGGINVLATGPNIPLVAGPGLMIADGGNIFITEIRNNTGDPTPRAFSITNVWPSITGEPTNWWNNAGAYPITDADLNWSVGGSDDTFRYTESLAIDSRTSPNYVSIVMKGGSGGMRILNAADGSLVKNINQDVGVFYVGTGWDNVGNVYAGNAAHSWEVWSPPGANQATTPAVATVEVTAAVTQPNITNIAVSAGTVTIDFTGGASDPASAFTLLSSSTVDGTYSAAAGAVITGSAGSYQATVPTSGDMQFYLIQR